MATKKKSKIAAKSAISALDLCISFDDTGSMSSVRKQVRQRATELVESLSDSIPGIRFAVIIHNDYCDYPRHIFTMDFSTDIKKIVAFIEQSSPCGGGDAPECYELALKEARNFSWKSENKALVMIGDEIPHEVGYTDYHRRWTGKVEIDWRVEATKLGEAGVRIYGVQALGERRSTSFYETISRLTNGIKLDLSQFQHIHTYINAIAYHQSGQLEEFEKSDASFATNFSLKNMFNKLRGGVGDAATESKMALLSRFQVMKIEAVQEIRDFVESMGCTFRKGRGFYQLIERTADGKANAEIIQANKEVIFVDKETGEANADTNWCRDQLGIPFGTKATCRPLHIPEVMKKYDVFIQSNSFTRKLDPGTSFLYELEHT